MTKKLTLLLAIFLAGCGMTDQEVRQAKADCKSRGGDPVVMMTLYGATAEVRCW